MKSLGLTSILSVAGAVIVAVGGYFFWQYNNPDAQPPVALLGGQNAGTSEQTSQGAEVKTKTENEEAEANAETDKPKAESENAEAASEEQIETAKLTDASVAPSISLLRVEPDGSTIVAGNGPAGTVISLFNGDKKIGETTSEAGGDFAFVLDEPLAPGNHEITVASALQDGSTLPSVGLGLVQIPDPAKGGELTVLLTKPGEATQILTKTEVEPTVPEQQVAQAEQESSQTEQETASNVQGTAANSEEAVATQSEGAAEAGDENTQQQVVEEPAQPAAQVALQAADIEGNKIFVAGTGEPGSTVTLFMGKVFLGQTVVSENGSFLLEAEQQVPAGKHKIRADSLDSETWELLNSAEVSLVHEPEVAAEPVKEEEAEVAQTTPSQAGAEETEAETEQEQDTVSGAKDPAAAQPETKEVVAGASVIIRKGDSLWRVARRNYGRGIRYTTIFEANRDQIKNPRLIYPGQVLKVPEDQ